MNKIFNKNLTNNPTKKAIYLTIFLIPLYLVRFQIFWIPVNVLEVLVGVTFLIWMFKGYNLAEKKQQTFFGKYKIPIILILLGLISSAIFNGNSLQSWGIIKSWFLVPFIFSWVVLSEIKIKKDFENILNSIYLSTVAVSIISLAYYFLGELTYDGRLKAFYLSPNHLAMYLAPGILIGLYLVRNKKIKLKTKKLLAISFVFLLTSFYFTFSYAAWLAVAVTVLLIVILKTEKINFKKIGIIFAIASLLFYFQLNSSKLQDLVAFDERSSLSSRIMIWKSAQKIISDNVIFGIGPGGFQREYLEYQKYFPPYLEWAVPHPHNLYLAFWLQSGILGTLSFLWLMIMWLRALIKKTKNSNCKIDTVLLGIMLYVLIHGLVDTTYWKNDLAIIFWIIFILGIIPKKYSS